jgi:hypothetical protein
MAGVVGALVYGTAKSALAQVITPHWIAVVGPALASTAVLVAAHWGVYQGPAVFPVADIANLFGATLSRRELVVGRLRRTLALGAAAGVLMAGVVSVGLADEGRHVHTSTVAGLATGLGELGVLAMCAGWAVERSSRWERGVRRGTGLAVIALAAMFLAARTSGAGRAVALWSGPWGWAVQAAAGRSVAESWSALTALTVLTVVCTSVTLRDAGNMPTERHTRRSEGRAGAVASLTSMDMRTARQSLARPARQPRNHRGVELRALRSAIAKRGPRSATHWSAIAWRDAVAATRTTGPTIEGALLSAAGTAVWLLNADRPLVVCTSLLLIYFGAARMLGPLRAELDDTRRARVLLRLRLGHVLIAHTLVPSVVAAVAAAAAGVSVAAAGALPHRGLALVLIAIGLTLILTLCAAMAARRGGRVPYGVLVAATASDPSGGAFALATWLTWWPALGLTVAGVPIAIATHRGGSLVVAAGWIVLAVAFVAGLASRDPPDG